MAKDQDEEIRYWLDQAEGQFKLDVFERDKGICICGKPIQVIHHILTRKVWRGWKDAPTVIRELWSLKEHDFPFEFNPHIVLNGRGLCVNHHQRSFAHKMGKLATKLILLEVLWLHGEEEVYGEMYRAWYLRPPFVEYLR